MDIPVSYCGYSLHCTKCGDKTAVIAVDYPSDRVCIDALRRQVNEVALKAHRNHKFWFTKMWTDEEEQEGWHDRLSSLRN